MEQPQEPSSETDFSEEALRRYFEPILRQHARRLNARWWRWPLLMPTYHLLADALFWADEVAFWWKRGELEDALRYLWHYRTGLILGEARPGAEVWKFGKRLFPKWVGFHPSRCRPNRRYLVIYRAGRIASSRCLAELEREVFGNELPTGAE
jgi:hypothetical protein